MQDEIVLLNESVKNKVIHLREKPVILDSEVAALYGVETRDINKAVKNNPDKFPNGYIFELTPEEKREVVENFHHLRSIKYSKVNPKAFSEKGLYMLATIIKSPKATATTLQIIEVFSTMREIKRTIIDAVKQAEAGKEPKKIIEKVGNMVSNLIMPDMEDMETISIEDEAEFKFMGILKLTRKVVKKPKSSS